VSAVLVFRGDHGEDGINSFLDVFDLFARMKFEIGALQDFLPEAMSSSLESSVFLNFP